MNAPKLVPHKGKTIYYMDFSNIKSHEEFHQVFEISKSYIRSQPPKSVLAVSNLTGIHFNTDIRNAFADFIKGNEPYIKASSVFGVTGLIKVVYQAVTKLTGRNLKAVDDIEQAKDWLAGN